MTIIYPSNLNNKIDNSFDGSTITQSYGFLSESKKNDIIIFSAVGLYNTDSNFENLYDLILQKVKEGVILLLEVPQNWCTSEKFPDGCTNEGTFQLQPDNVKYLKNLLSYPNCVPLYTTNYFQIHLKCCDWISTQTDNPQSAIYFGSSNMYSSYHDEVGMYVTGDYTKDDLILHAVISRSMIIDDYADRLNIQIPQRNLHSYNYAKNFLYNIGNKYINQNKKLINNIYFPIKDVQFQLDNSETVYCDNGWSIKNMVENTVPISKTDNSNNLVKISGDFRIGLTPPTMAGYNWWNTFAYNLDMIIYLINNAKQYVKISVMELYLNDEYWTNGVLTDSTSLELFNSLKNAVKKGIHILILTNIGLNWDPKGKQKFKNFSYNNLISKLSGDGTVQIRYRNYGVTELHNKLYISDQDVILSSQHPSDVFMYIYGSSIMFNDLTIRNYYDNYFNSLWSVSSINLSDRTIQTPLYNTYPIIKSPNIDGTIVYDNWFERKGNLLLCSTDEAPFSSCCGGLPTNKLENKVLYEVIFSDPNLLNPLDGNNNNLFYGWWYNQIRNCPDNTWLYIVSAPVSNLGSISSYENVGSGEGKGDNGNGIKAIADQKLNKSFYNAYRDALKRGITIYICGWYFPPKNNYPASDMIDDFINDLSNNGTQYMDQIKRYNTDIFWHEKIFATPNAVYIGSQNALLPDSYESGFVFYADVGSKSINPLYFEVLKIAQQFVNIEAGYKPLTYNMNKPLVANWVNNVTKDVELCNSFIAVSPGNEGPMSISNNKYASALFGDNVTTESEIMTRIAKEAKEYLLISCYDMGYTITYPSNVKTVYKGAVGEVINAADRGVKVTIILTRQGILARLKDLKDYGKFITDIIQHENIDFYIQDKSCTPEIDTKYEYSLTRQCHHVHAKIFLNESELYNSSSNFNHGYLESSVRNSGVYTNNNLAHTQFVNFFKWIKSKKECIGQINNQNDLNCDRQNPVILDTNKISVFNPYTNIPKPSPKPSSKSNTLIYFLLGFVVLILIAIFVYYLIKK